MLKKGAALLLMIVCILFMSAPASARLSAVGPINPENGFPLWYQDANGIILELPTPPLGDGLNAPTMIFDPPVDTPFSQQIGFGEEAMYWDATAVMDVNGGRAVLVLALEAAFAQGPAINGDQIVFARIRIRVDIPATGAGQTYTVKHPYGTDVFRNVPAGPTGINSTIDVGVCPGNFSGALDSQIGPFLRQLSPPPPAGWIGDGATLATVTGSPIGQNIFRVEGPDIGGPGIDFVETPLFKVSGHILAGGGPLVLNADKVTFLRTATDTTIQVFATSMPGSTVTATIPGVATPLTLTPGLGGFRNTYFGQVLIPNPFTLPTSVTLNAARLAQTAQVSSSLVDVVTITRAEYDTPTQRLVVTATSSDTTGNPVLTVTAPAAGTLTAGRLIARIGVPTPTVTVTSASGGTATVSIKVIP